MKYNTKKLLFFSVVLSLAACDSKPKVIEAEVDGQTPVFQDLTSPAAAGGGEHNHDMQNAEHEVVVQEILNTEKYSYLRVKEEGEEEYWIAITKQDVKKGSTCYYRGGLLKKNFQSKEFNRVFETVYLVGDFRDGSETASTGGIPENTEALAPPKHVKAAPGAIKISELVSNLNKYSGKTVKITGKCVKVNLMIMGRNWLHIQDGSGKNMDLTVTTTENIQPGAIVTLEGTIAVNKDFGAGYKYDYIMEAAVAK